MLRKLDGTLAVEAQAKDVMHCRVLTIYQGEAQRFHALQSSYKLDGGVVNSYIMNHNGGLLVCGCNDGSVRIIDLRRPDVIASWPAHQGEVFTVRLSPQENNIYTIGSDNRVGDDRCLCQCSTSLCVGVPLQSLPLLLRAEYFVTSLLVGAWLRQVPTLWTKCCMNMQLALS